jgi:REP element-mobilizing transposase RayT
LLGIWGHGIKYNPEVHHRRSIRLKEYDYSNAGAYFVTMCVKNRECLFGSIHNREMIMNDAGQMVYKWWNELAHKFNNIELDGFVIMPNHMHGIIVIVGADLCVCPDERNNNTKKGAHAGAPLHRVIQWFKTMTTNEYIRGIELYRWQSVYGKLWQRNYYERVIRDEYELTRIREYIIHNPLQWDEDEYNPENL